MDAEHAAGLLRAEPTTTGIFTDFDGTLSAIVDRPQDAELVPGAADVLGALVRQFALMAVVSGRSLNDLRQRIDIAGVLLLGSYGRERSDVAARQRTGGWETVSIAAARRIDGLEGVVLERKGAGIAIHYRLAPDREPEVRRIAADLSDTYELEVRPGRRVVELVAPGPGKAEAVTELLRARGLRTFAYVGDDIADLEVFEAASTVDARGVLVAVDSAEAPPELVARADLALSGPDAVVEFLRRLV